MKRLVWMIALVAAGGCSTKAPPAADSSPGPSRGWQSDTRGFVPDNSDIAEQNRRRLANPPAESPAPSVLLRASGGARRDLDAAVLADVPGAAGRIRTLGEVVAWAFPGRRWTRAILTRGDNSTVELRAAQASLVELKVNRRGDLRIKLPGDEDSGGGGEDHGPRGEGVKAQRRRVVLDIHID
jgi:hypothetical protein